MELQPRVPFRSSLGNDAAIVVDQLTKSFRNGRVRALSGISLQVRRGEVLGLIGPNGAGKTTFIGCLVGLVFPTSGAVRVDGHSPDATCVKRCSGYLPERLTFDGWMTGRGFVSYHHALSGGLRLPRYVEVEEVLERVELERSAWDRKLKTYSRGMLQRLGLAQALVGHPRFLFLDEPTSGVDPTGVLLVRHLLNDLRGEGVTVVVNSHQLDQLERVCDRAVFVRSGRIEGIEDLRGHTANPRPFRVRWEPAASLVPLDTLSMVAASAGVTLLGAGNGHASFEVTASDSLPRLLADLIAAGLPVIEASFEQTRLESYFERTP